MRNERCKDGREDKTKGNKNARKILYYFLFGVGKSTRCGGLGKDDWMMRGRACPPGIPGVQASEGKGRGPSGALPRTHTRRGVWRGVVLSFWGNSLGRGPRPGEGSDRLYIIKSVGSKGGGNTERAPRRRATEL